MYFEHCPASDIQNGDKASPSIIFAGRAHLVKMLITLETHGIFGSNFVYYCILTLSSRWYVKRAEASQSSILSSLALLVKMLINLEPCGSFG